MATTWMSSWAYSGAGEGSEVEVEVEGEGGSGTQKLVVGPVFVRATAPRAVERSEGVKGRRGSVASRSTSPWVVLPGASGGQRTVV